MVLVTFKSFVPKTSIIIFEFALSTSGPSDVRSWTETVTENVWTAGIGER